MWQLDQEIIEAARSLDLTVVQMPKADGVALKHKAFERFAPAGLGHRFAWEHFQDSVSFRSENAWQLIGEYVGHAPAILFVDDRDDTGVFRFENGHDIVAVLGDCFRFEFYVTNSETECLLCENRHDYLIAAGAAKRWLEKRITATAGSQ